MPELDFVGSESRAGVSIVSVNIRESYTEMRPIWDNLRRKVDSIAGELPEGVSEPEVNDDFGDVYGIVVGLTGEGFSFKELHTIADDVKAVFLQIPDTAKVEILGVQEERIFLEYNNARLADLGLSPGLLTQILEERNIVVSGGSFKLGGERIALEPSGNFKSMAEIEATLLRLPGTNQLFQLRDVATLKRSYVDPPEELVSVNGEPAVAIAIAMRERVTTYSSGRRYRTPSTASTRPIRSGSTLNWSAFLPGRWMKRSRALWSICCRPLPWSVW